MRHLLLVSLLVSLAGCPTSHPSEDAAVRADAPADSGSPDAGTIAGLDPATRMVELTDTEWSRLCGWISALAPAEFYHCDRETFRGSDDCPGCTPYDWTVATCQADGPFYWRMQPSDCEATVAMLATCREEMASLVCWQAYPDTPSCAALACAVRP